MRVLNVIPSMNPVTGGPCQGVRNLSTGFRKFNSINEVLCLDDSNSTFIKQDTFKIHAIGKGRGIWKYNSEISDWLCKNSERFDVIIIHGIWSYHSYAVRTFIKNRKNQASFNGKIPNVYVMPHGMLDPYFQKAKNRRLKAIRNWFYWKLIEGNVVNEADGILFTCEEELRKARETFRPYHPKKELNVGYGINAPPKYITEMDNAFIKKYSQLAGRPYLLFLSRIHQKKGLDVLIKSYLLLKKNGISLPKLVIAGPGLETSYGQQMQKLSVEDSDIIFSGMLEGNAKWGAIYGCEAFVLPSHQENFGIAIVEAMACGKPVLISNKVNIWREITMFKGAIVAEDTQTGTINLLASWIKLTENEKLEMGKEAKRSYETYFSAETAANTLINALTLCSKNI